VSRRRDGLSLALAVVAIMASVGAAMAGATIETSSFALTLPDGWIQNLASKPVSARGPRGELLQISSSGVTGQPTPQESARILREIEEVAVRSMGRAAADPALVTVTPLKKTMLPSGATLHEMVSKSRDGRSLLAQFSATGPRALVLLTVELPASAASSIDAVRASVAAIQWAR